MRPCGNPKCSTSTGIHDGLTFGSGRLDEYGYWEFPCDICARHFDSTAEATRQQLLDEGSKPENLDWLDHLGWPFPGQDIAELTKQVQGILGERSRLDQQFDKEMYELFGIEV